MFQSRCRDSIIGDAYSRAAGSACQHVSVPLPGFNYWRLDGYDVFDKESKVSVPLPGFNYWRPRQAALSKNQGKVSVPLPGFNYWRLFARVCTAAQGIVSVPLPGFNYWRPSFLRLPTDYGLFQSRCRDSIIGDGHRRSTGESHSRRFQSRCRDSIIGDHGSAELRCSDWLVSVPLPGFNYWRPT